MIGTIIAYLLVKVLNGIFDPPPRCRHGAVGLPDRPARAGVGVTVLVVVRCRADWWPGPARASCATCDAVTGVAGLASIPEGGP